MHKLFFDHTGREPTAYPGHQPELDSSVLKLHYNSFTTTSREAYKRPNNSLTH